jgi:hypothetical protein
MSSTKGLVVAYASPLEQYSDSGDNRAPCAALKRIRQRAQCVVRVTQTQHLDLCHFD